MYKSKGLAGVLVIVLMVGNWPQPAIAACSTIMECSQQAVEAATRAMAIAETLVPKGAVMTFNLDTCPPSWEEFEPAYGRFVRGIDKSGEKMDPSGERDPGDIQEDSFQNHRHNNFSSVWPNAGTSESVRSHLAGGDKGYKKGDFGIQEPVGQNVRFNDSETRPKNVALLYCEKK